MAIVGDANENSRFSFHMLLYAPHNDDHRCGKLMTAGIAEQAVFYARCRFRLLLALHEMAMALMLRDDPVGEIIVRYQCTEEAYVCIKC